MTPQREWLLGLMRRGIRLGLERMRRVLEDIELPERIIRVGGTNGKGSVCALLEGILMEAGYTVGVYTSPELERINERITVDGVPISDEELDRHTAWLMHHSVELTFFEAMTAIALRHFQGVDIVVLEVGMGGRHDATAAVDADNSVVTNVSLDHTEHLGGTVEAIAGEIAGAITGGDVVTACTGAALDVVAQRAARCNATLHPVTDGMWRQTGPRRFIVQARRRYELKTRLDGVYQGQNVALAVKTAEVLGVDVADILDGVAAAWLPGRLERLGNVMLDGAHNPAAMHALRTSLKQMQLEPACIVFGAMRDKDIPGIIRELPPGDVIATAAATGRAAAPASTAAMLRTEGRHCITEENVAAALQKAREIAGQGVILVTGSIRLVGDARELLH